ncbi:MAG: hypothetical protein J5I81_07345 [Nitrococcus mobilis]|nr:hypothetical protein [Nitrococcus mobilis]
MGGAKGDIQNYIASLSSEIAGQHKPGSQTLVILNNVERAQQLYTHLGTQLAEVPRLLLHARFRPAERRVIEQRLHDAPSATGRIVIATQAIEAGLDVSSRTLFTELAPWASLVQRFGRCNRTGEFEAASVFWIDIATDTGKLARPYEDQPLDTARASLASLKDAEPAHLPSVDAGHPLTQVLRRRDLLELFNTDADLSGFDVDISPYIRDSDTPPVQVFWRSVENGNTDGIGKPERPELCPASIGQIGSHLGSKLKGEPRRAWRWDVLEGRWATIKAKQMRPGMILLLDAAEGGYKEDLGFVSGDKTPVAPIPGQNGNQIEDSNDADVLTQIGCWISLPDHLSDVASDAAALCQSLHLRSCLGKCYAHFASMRRSIAIRTMFSAVSGRIS